MRKKTICAMMTGFLAVQGIEVHAETQQTTGEAASAVESVELDAEIIENSDVTDADGKAGPEELLPDEKSEEEPPIEEKPEPGIQKASRPIPIAAAASEADLTPFLIATAQPRV